MSIFKMPPLSMKMAVAQMMIMQLLVATQRGLHHQVLWYYISRSTIVLYTSIIPNTFGVSQELILILLMIDILRSYGIVVYVSHAGFIS